MSKYTITLKDLTTMIGSEAIINWFSSYDLNDYLTPEQQQMISQHGLWSKEKLAKKIYRHYFFKEIGFETPAVFAEQTKIYLEELMEEYLPLIYSCAIEYDPLVNVDFTETYEHAESQNGLSTATSGSESNGTGLTISSDTPQGNINKQDILNGRYASSTQGNETTNVINDNTTAHSSTEGNSQYVKRVKGNSGVSATAQKMVEQYRQNVKAYDREIINKLGVLFMGVY